MLVFARQSLRAASRDPISTARWALGILFLSLIASVVAIFVKVSYRGLGQIGGSEMVVRKLGGTLLAASLLASCSSDNGQVTQDAMRKAMCKPPEYNTFTKGTEKWTLDQWNDRRYNCIHHYAQYYANGRDSADTIADLVTNFDCASETERVVEAAMASPNVMVRTIHSEPEMQKDTRYVAIEDVLTYRSNNCHMDVAHLERK